MSTGEIIARVCHDQKLKDGLIGKLCELYKSGELCDYELKTEDDGSFKVHRWVLSAISTFFDERFHNAEFNENNPNSYLIRHISSENLDKIIEFIYTGKIDIPYDNAKEITNTTLFLGLSPLIEHCIGVLCETVNDENCLDLLLYSEACLSYGTELTKKSLKYACKKFNEFIEKPEFVELLPSTMEILVQQNRFAYTEENLYLAVSKWITYKFEDREKYVNGIISKIRFRNCSYEFAKSNILQNNPLLKSQDFNKNLISYLGQFWTLQNSVASNEPINFSSRPDSEKSLYAIFGENVIMYDDEHFEFSMIITNINDSRQNFGHTIFGEDKIFICGGSIDGQLIDSCKYFSVMEFCWKDLPSMMACRQHSKSIEFNNKIYVCGGYNTSFTKSVEIFDINNSEWSEGPNLENADKIEYGFDVCRLDNCIYFASANCVQRLDPRKNNWDILNTRNTDEWLWSLEAYDNLIYGFGYESISTFDIRNQKWLEKKKSYKEKYGGYPRTYASISNSEIYVFGKSTNQTKEYYLQTYNLSDLTFLDCQYIIHSQDDTCEAVFFI